MRAVTLRSIIRSIVSTSESWSGASAPTPALAGRQRDQAILVARDENHIVPAAGE